MRSCNVRRMGRLSIRLILPILAIAALPVLAACGGDDASPDATAPSAAQTPSTEAPAPEDTPEPTTAPVTPKPEGAPSPSAADKPAPTEPPATEAPVPVTTPEATEPLAMSETEKLVAYAAQHANGPGAIFVADPTQLVGPPPIEGLMFSLSEELYNQAFLGALFGVEEMGIPGHMFIFTSDYYRELIGKANLISPTELTSSGESIEIQHACIDRNLPPCVLIQSFPAPNLDARTDGQVKLSVTSFPELGIGGTDTLTLVGDGTLEMSNIYTGYVAGALPPIEVKSLWGLGANLEASYLSQVGMGPDIDTMLSEATDGGIPINRNWFAGSDQWFFSKEPIQSLADFQGKIVRIHAGALTDLILGLGARPAFIPPGAHYLAVQNGTVDVGTTGALLAVSSKLHEVTDYMTGPIVGFGYTNNVINKEKWDKIPTDLKQIIVEEGAETELEGLRLAPYQNLLAVQINQAQGIQPIPFSADDILYIIGVIAPERIIPGWLERLGYPERNQDAVRIFNEHVGAYTGLWIDEDGSVQQVSITKGPLASQ